MRHGRDARGRGGLVLYVARAVSKRRAHALRMYCRYFLLPPQPLVRHASRPSIIAVYLGWELLPPYTGWHDRLGERSP
jgi:hypothetical protein